MARLTVRGLPDELVDALKARAAQAGRPAEAEHRRILEDALRPATGPGRPGAAPARRTEVAADLPGATEPP